MAVPTSLRAMDHRGGAAVPRPDRTVVLLIAMPFVAVAAGWLVAHGHATYVAGAAAIAAAVVVGLIYPAQSAALLLLVVLNGVPVVNLSHRLPGNLKVQDLAVFGLMALLIAFQDRAPSDERRRIIRTATIWSACFIGWWTYELARSYLLDGIPWLKAALLGRDFLYFAILLPLALRVRLPTRQLRLAGVLLLGGVALCAIGQDIQSITHVSVSWLAHPAIVDNTIGLSRLYSSTSLAINTALIFAVALLLSRESRAMRRPLAALVVLFFVDAAVGLTRANYFALAVALLAGIVFYAARYGSLTKVFVRVGITVPLVVLAVVAFNGIAGGGSIPAVHRVTSRASSGLSALFHATGTVGYREHVDRDMLRVLGHKWPVGLGFLHPGARYVPGVPGGTIRNADTGVFNALMTMGIVGVLLIYAPLLYGIRELVRASARLRATAAALPPWILYGGAAWIAWAIAGSPTLVTLFSVPGLVTSTVTLAALAHLATEPSRLAPGARRTPVAAGTYGLASTLAADAG